MQCFLITVYLLANSFVDVFASSWSWTWSGSWTAIILLIMVVILWGTFEKARKSYLLWKVQRDVKTALKINNGWDVHGLEEITKKIFFEYYKGFENKDLTSLKYITTIDFYDSIRLRFQKELQGKVNIIKNISIDSMNLISIKDRKWKDGDIFVMEVSSSMINYIIDSETREFIKSYYPKDRYESFSQYSDRSQNQKNLFIEYWVFFKYKNSWKLHDIRGGFAIYWNVHGLSERKIIKLLKKEASA